MKTRTTRKVSLELTKNDVLELMESHGLNIEGIDAEDSQVNVRNMYGMGGSAIEIEVESAESDDDGR